MIALLLAALLSPFSFTIRSETRTAYQSRGKVAEDRPLQAFRFSGDFDTKHAGRIGVWNWDGSSLTDRRRADRRNWFNEMDFGLFWRYDWAFDEAGRWKLVTTVHKSWITYHGYRDPLKTRKTCASINEWRLEEALENPYVTPFMLMRRGTHARDWTYWKVGARKRIPLVWDLYFKPSYDVELGNAWLLQQRYGAQTDGGTWSAGAMASNLRLEIGWDVTDWCTVYAEVHQFDTLSSQGRRSIKASSAAYARRDLTIGTVGVLLKF